MSMVQDAAITDARGRITIQDPPLARFLFQDTRASWLWLVVRVFVGFEWLESGWGKFNNPAWMDGSGRGISAFWQRAVAVPEPPATAPITYDWYRAFLQFLIDANAAPWFSYVIVFGELLVGLGLIAGAFVGLAATGGLVMNMSFMLAGTTSTNPLMALLAILLVLAWKNAGYLGLDRFLLPMLGTPWQRRPAAPAAERVAERERQPVH
jgi:thiosulfate dehydrogenase [quinone] large subunit